MNAKMHVNCHCGNCELVRTQHDDELVKATLSCVVAAIDSYTGELRDAAPEAMGCSWDCFPEIAARIRESVAAWRSAKEGKGGK